MKYLASLVLVLSLGSAAFAADASAGSPISDTQAKNLIKADANLKKSKHRHRKHHKAAAKTTSTAPAATPASDAAPATK
ncbi:MAG: hypothetical protein P4L53_24980 [Candidatus Obscuribacterales bacterium]|nr:hypothetical protein [Candidatus Obscuribacterales bacterium]